jgi:hypothetical protein
LFDAFLKSDINIKYLLLTIKMSCERFIYRPNETGTLSYNVPIICDDLCKEISSKIQKLLDERSNFRKSDKGYGRIENYGFKPTEVFYDMELCKGIKLKANPSEILIQDSSITPLNPEDINEKGAYLMLSFDPFKENIGKRAFKNEVSSMLEGNYLIKSHKRILDESVESAKWLNEKYPNHLRDILLRSNR